MDRGLTVGVFDSGVGGQAVVNAIKQAMPDAEVIYAEDRQNVPYGTKTPAELKHLVTPILNRLSEQGCDAIVIACNTVTTTIIEDLRREIPVPLIGMEPMVKPAAERTRTGAIAVCATPATLASKRYRWLKDTYAKGIRVLEPDCSDWALMIESNAVDHESIRQRITEVCEQGADVIVLGCTHYHWIEENIRQVADSYDAAVIQPTEPVIRQLKRVVAGR